MKIALKFPPVAAALAFFLAGIGLLSGLQQPALAVFALIPLAAGIGILRRRVWSAYGFALFELAQVVVSPILLSRTGTASRATVLFTIGFNAGLAALFFFTGRTLAASGAVRGRAIPWIAIAAVISLPFLFVQAFMIPSGGMEDTLLIGDRILTRVFPAVRPSRGEIVVFRYPMDRRQTYVKRVIGVPGDRIRISEGVVYLNGSVLRETYVVHKLNSPGNYGNNFPRDAALSPLLPNSPDMAALREMLQRHVIGGEVVTPAGKYFVMGDNRDNSLDSRYWGFLDPADMIGKPILIYDSQDPVSHHTRWNRMFRTLPSS